MPIRTSASCVCAHDTLVGIFTVTDACRALAEVLESHTDDGDSVA